MTMEEVLEVRCISEPVTCLLIYLWSYQIPGTHAHDHGKCLRLVRKRVGTNSPPSGAVHPHMCGNPLEKFTGAEVLVCGPPISPFKHVTSRAGSERQGEG
jgi:hypothetical protein